MKTKNNTVAIELKKEKKEGKTPNFFQKIKKDKKKVIIISILAVILIISLGSLSLFLLFREKGSDQSLDPINSSGEKSTDIALLTPEKIKDQTAPLSGKLIFQDEYKQLQQQHPVAVIIENHPDARPVSGIDQADLVFEALAEGGISRFLAVFHQNNPEKIGPVRSMRTYFLDWTNYLNPVFMHIGYAPPAPQSADVADVLAFIRQNSIRSLALNGGSFWRSTDRQAPHNAYVDFNSLQEKALSLWEKNTTTNNFAKFRDQEISSENSQEISLNWNGWGETAYSVIWNYDPENNHYLRTTGTETQKDTTTKEQISTKNILFIYCQQGLANDSLNHITYQTSGSGQLQAFIGGKTIQGTWSKQNFQESYYFFDENGEEIEFNRGKTWLTMIPENSQVSF